MAIAVGENLGPYRIISARGAGGMGEVFRAWDTRLERAVAVKVLRSGLLLDGERRGRFRKEALALARLNHPNIATVYDVGQHDGVDYIVMEYVEGESLAERLLAGSLSVQEGLLLGTEVAAALEEAHEQGVVHRDLKPSNIAITTKGRAKVLDFGLAKLLASADPEATMSSAETQGPVGTLLYMSPEQAEGKVVDSRTDLWSLGVVLYEALSGKKPFQGHSALTVLQSVTKETPKRLSESCAGVPMEAERIISRALEKDVQRRYQTASDMRRDLGQVLTQVSGHAVPQGKSVRVSRNYVIAIVAAVILLASVGGWLYWRSEKQHWAREQAIPEITKLKDENRGLSAFLLLKEVERYLPSSDPQVKQVADEILQTASIISSPPGANVEIQDYLTPDGAWYPLGTTPLNNVQIPKGYFRWKLSAAETGENITAPETEKKMDFALDNQRNAPQGMVAVPANTWEDYIADVGFMGPFQLPLFYMDRYEVTNRDFQKFVDAGAYKDPKYWKEKFVRDGHEIRWQDAMTLFRDSTGRYGPSTWEAGHFPEGQGDYPVSGVSWYEASAYAVFAGKSLPTLPQWYEAISADAASYAVQMSNFSSDKPAPVGSFHDVGVYGTYDLAGNVREWVLNAVGSNYFILGGAWDSPTYYYTEPEAFAPFDRSAENGFRCVQNTKPLPIAVMQSVTPMERDFAKIKPISDEMFRAYTAPYSYVKTPLNAKDEGVVKETEDWKEEKVTFDAAYNGERMIAYLFLPKNVKPPYQTILFFPSARVLDISDSKNLGDLKFFDYLVQSGRAVMYPIYKETYERRTVGTFPWTLDVATEQFKDLSRSVDYLETRNDIDSKKLAYVGVSMGSAEGVTYTTLLQDRLRTVILLDGGFFFNQFQPGVDPANFAPRLKIPVLMVNGRYDFSFPLKESQEPLFKMLGTPEQDKRHVVMESPHDVTVKHTELVQETVNWLDKYLGPVQ
jgi:eukaryotic-like serine/threonine-protein kinase